MTGLVKTWKAVTWWRWWAEMRISIAIWLMRSIVEEDPVIP